MTRASVRDAVLSAVLAVARQRDDALTKAEPNQSLSSDLGFDSLDLAQVVAELEVQLGLDPFARESSSRVLTVGDLVAIYERASTR